MRLAKSHCRTARDVIAWAEVRALPVLVLEFLQMGDPAFFFRRRAVDLAGKLHRDIKVAGRADAIRIDCHQHTRPGKEIGPAIVRILPLNIGALPGADRIFGNPDAEIKIFRIASFERGRHRCRWCICIRQREALETLAIGGQCGVALIILRGL
jgi:hypothetical protein